MRSAYSAVFLYTLACASVPATSSSVVTGTNAPAARAPAASTSSAPVRGQLFAGNATLEYFSGETLHDVLRRRAPLYLRTRGNTDLLGTGGDPIKVYLNGHFIGGTEALTSIPASDVFSVQRMSPTEAMMRFGPKHTNGVLAVTLVRR